MGRVICIAWRQFHCFVSVGIYMILQNGSCNTPLCAVALLLGMFSTPAVAELADNGEWKNRVDQCRRILDGIPKTYSAQIVRKGFSGNVDNFSQTIWRFHNNLASRTEQHGKNASGDTEARTFAALASADYWAALRLGADGHWRIREIHVSTDSTYSSKMRNGIGDFVLEAAFPLNSDYYPDLASARRVEKLTDDNSPSIVRFRFEFDDDPSNMVNNVEYLVICFDDSKQGMIVQVDEKRRSRTFGTSIEYDDFVKMGKGILPLTARSYLLEGVGEQRKLWSVDTITLSENKVTASTPEFRLTHYGLPEPVRARSNSSIWIWITVIGVMLFIGGGLILRRIAR